jgi:hypothetical protein
MFRKSAIVVEGSEERRFPTETRFLCGFCCIIFNEVSIQDAMQYMAYLKHPDLSQNQAKKILSLLARLPSDFYSLTSTTRRANMQPLARRLLLSGSPSRLLLNPSLSTKASSIQTLGLLSLRRSVSSTPPIIATSTSAPPVSAPATKFEPYTFMADVQTGPTDLHSSGPRLGFGRGLPEKTQNYDYSQGPGVLDKAMPYFFLGE